MSMTIYEVLHELRKAKPETPVCFAFCSIVPTTVRSWRGVYAEPALGWVEYSSAKAQPTARYLIAELENAISGARFGGWKGGEYAYTGSHTLHVDCPGEWTHTEIDRIESDDYQVIIHTAREELT